MNTSARVLNTLLLSGLSSLTFAAEFSGMLKSQSAFATQSSDSHSKGTMQQEWLLDLEYQGSFLGGDITAIGRVRYDTVDDLNPTERPKTYSSINGPIENGSDGSIELRELYWETYTDSVYWRLGKQQVVWGEADGLKLLDLVNPQSYREFILDDFDDSRIPVWMVNAEYTLGDNSVLQLLWIPDTTAHELAPAGSPFALSSPSQVPQNSGNFPVTIEEAQAPDHLIKDSDAGLRLTSFVGGWDISLNYLYHYVDAPVVRLHNEGSQWTASAEYERSHLWGGTASNAFGDWTLRTEIAYETNRYHRSTTVLPGVEKADQWSTVIGLDWQGWTDQFVSVQWFQTTITGESSTRVNKRREDVATLLWESKFYNETLTLSWLHIHSLDNDDGVVRPKVVYNYQANLDIYIGMDKFYGEREGVFGQFKETDRINIGFEWGF